MAAFGLVTTLVALLLPMLRPVVAAPVNPKDILNRVAHHLNPDSHTLQPNYRGEDQPEFSQNHFDPFVDHDSGWQALSGASAGQHATIHPNWQDWAAQPHCTSQYFPDMTAVHLYDQPWYPTAQRFGVQQDQPLEPWQQHLASHDGDQSSFGTGYQPNDAGMHAVVGAASSSRGGAGPHSNLPGIQQHSSDPVGPVGFDHLLGYSPQDFPGTVSGSTPPRLPLPRSQAVQPYPPRKAAATKENVFPHEDVRRVAPVRATAKALPQAEPETENRATLLDLRNYAYRNLDGDPASNPTLALRKLSDDDLLHHAEVAFAAERTAVQPPLRKKTRPAKSAVLRNFVYSTKHQSAVVEELFNRRLRDNALLKGKGKGKARPIQVIPDSNWVVSKQSNVDDWLRGIADKGLDATQGPFEEPHGESVRIRSKPYLGTFKLGKYGIYVLGVYGQDGVAMRNVFALDASAVARFRDNVDALGVGDFKPDAVGVFLGRLSE